MKKFFTPERMVSIILQVAQLVVTSYGLYYVMHHSH